MVIEIKGLNVVQEHNTGGWVGVELWDQCSRALMLDSRFIPPYCSDKVFLGMILRSRCASPGLMYTCIDVREKEWMSDSTTLG